MNINIFYKFWKQWSKYWSPCIFETELVFKNHFRKTYSYNIPRNNPLIFCRMFTKYPVYFLVQNTLFLTLYIKNDRFCSIFWKTCISRRNINVLQHFLLHFIQSNIHLRCYTLCMGLAIKITKHESPRTIESTKLKVAGIDKVKIPQRYKNYSFSSVIFLPNNINLGLSLIIIWTYQIVGQQEF